MNAKCSNCDTMKFIDLNDEETELKDMRCAVCDSVGTLKCQHSNLDPLGGCSDCGKIIS